MCLASSLHLKPLMTFAYSLCFMVTKQRLCCRQHGMPAEHFQDDASYKARMSEQDSKKHQGIPARHWNSAPVDEGDSLDAFVVETRLVPASLSQIPDRLPEHVSLGHKQYAQMPATFLSTPLQHV